MKNFTTGWHLTARYIYTLSLDGPGLAWEYLRRNRNYQSDWLQRQQHPEVTKRWHLLAFEDPALDARKALPLWSIDSDDLIWLTGAPGSGADAFSVWNLPGEKRMAHDGKRRLLTVTIGHQELRMALDDTVIEGEPVAYLIPADAHPQTHFKAVERQRRIIKAAPPEKHYNYTLPRPDRIAMMHMHSLQAIDGFFAGATHREIAEVLFGVDRVFQEWSTNSELRVRIRHLLKRARDYKRGEYRRLLTKHTSQK